MPISITKEIIKLLLLLPQQMHKYKTDLHTNTLIIQCKHISLSLDDCDHDLWRIHISTSSHTALQPLVCTLICSYENQTLLCLKVTPLSPTVRTKYSNATMSWLWKQKRTVWQYHPPHWWKPNGRKQKLTSKEKKKKRHCRLKTET